MSNVLALEGGGEARLRAERRLHCVQSQMIVHLQNLLLAKKTSLSPHLIGILAYRILEYEQGIVAAAI